MVSSKNRELDHNEEDTERSFSHERNKRDVLKEAFMSLRKLIRAENKSVQNKRREVGLIFENITSNGLDCMRLSWLNQVLNLLKSLELLENVEERLGSLIYQKTAKVIQGVILSFNVTSQNKVLRNIVKHISLLLEKDNVPYSCEAEMTRVCELYYQRDCFDCELCVLPALMKLLRFSILEKANKSVLSRINKIRSGFSLFELDHEDSLLFRKSALEALCNTLYLSTPTGRKILACFWGLGDTLMREMFITLKQQLNYLTHGLLKNYAEVIFMTWCTIDDPLKKQDFEYIVVNPICEYSIFLRNSKTRGHCALLIDESFHKRKRIDGVDSMLARMYSSIFTNLSCDNPVVRTNSLQVLRKAFPIRDPESTPEDEAILLKKQIESLKALLVDDFIQVRIAAIDTCGHILKYFWDLIPIDSRKELLLDAVKLSWDHSSGRVRAQALKLFLPLLNLPQSKKVVESLLEKLVLLIFEKAPQPRKLVIQMLLFVQTDSTLDITTFIELQDLLKILAIEKSSSVELCKLLRPYFFPAKSETVGSREQFNRILSLLNVNFNAGIKFVSQLHLVVGMSKAIKVIKMFGVWIKGHISSIRIWMKGKTKKMPHIDIETLRNAVLGMNKVWESIEENLEVIFVKELGEIISYNGFVKPFLSLIYNKMFYKLFPKGVTEKDIYLVREDIKNVLLSIVARYPPESKILDSIQHNLCNYCFTCSDSNGDGRECLEKSRNTDVAVYFMELNTFLRSEVLCLFRWRKQDWLFRMVANGIGSVLDSRKDHEDSGFSFVTCLWMIHFTYQQGWNFLERNFQGKLSLLRTVSEKLFLVIKSFKVSDEFFNNPGMLALLVETLLMIDVMHAIFLVKQQKTSMVEVWKEKKLKIEVKYYNEVVKWIIQKDFDLNYIRSCLDIQMAYQNDFEQLRSEGVLIEDLFSHLKDKISSWEVSSDFVTGVLKEELCTSKKSCVFQNQPVRAVN